MMLIKVLTHCILYTLPVTNLFLVHIATMDHFDLKTFMFVILAFSAHRFIIQGSYVFSGGVFQPCVCQSPTCEASKRKIKQPQRQEVWLHRRNSGTGSFTPPT